MKRVFVAGGATFDSIVHVNKFFGPVPGTIFSHGLHETTGGTGSGKAMNLARLGFDTRFHYFAGKDRYAREINKSLKKAGVRPYQSFDPAGTERHFNIMEDSGARISIYTAYSTFKPDLPRPLMNRLEREKTRNSRVVRHTRLRQRQCLP